jgi:hypothetical protein
MNFVSHSKRTRFTLVLFLLVLCAVRLSAQAQDYTYITNNGSIMITGYTGTLGVVVIPETIDGFPVTAISGGDYYGGKNNWDKMTDLTIGDNVTSIGAQAFANCTNLISVVVGNGVTEIYDLTFINCENLTRVTLGTNVTSIYTWGFGICPRLASISDLSNLVNIYSSAFSGCSGLTNIVLGSNVTYIGRFAFFECGSLASFIIPDAVPYIEESTFESCSNLTAIVIGNGVTSIGAQAFLWCTSLAHVTIPNNVTNIDNAAFDGCGATNIIIGSGLASITYAEFEGCLRLTEIRVDEENPFYSSVDGVLFNKDQTMLIKYPGGKVGDYVVPDCVTNFQVSAFGGPSHLINVTIPKHISRIEHATFRTGPNLLGVYFKGNAPEAIGQVFGYASNAVVYYLPGSTNWGATFDGQPTALWQPRIPGGDGFGVQTNHFGFNISWASGMVTVVESCTSLTDSSWTPIQTNTLSSDSLFFSDPDWINWPNRFYRICWTN